MPTPIREQIMAALESALLGIGGVTVERNRPDEFPVGRLPALNLLDGDQAPDHSVHGITTYVMTASVEGFVKGGSGTAVVTALNALYASVATLCGTDQTLGGLAVRVDEGRLAVALDRGSTDQPEAAFALDIEIEFVTKVGDPYAPGP